MAAPTFVTEYESTWTNNSTPQTASVSVNNGDVLVVGAVAADNPTTIGTPTGGGLTYTLQQSVVLSSNCNVYLWTAVATSTQTFTLSLTRTTGTDVWGFNCLRWSGSDGVGASSKTNTTGAPSLSITTLAANSAVAAFVGDWNATDGTVRTWRTVNSVTPSTGNGLEVTYSRTAGIYAAYGAYWTDAGSAGAKTVGLSAPAGQTYAIVAVEVKGTAGGTGATVTPSVVAAVAAVPTPTLSTGSQVSPAAVVAVATAPAPSVLISSVITPAAVAGVATIAAPTLSTGARPTPSVVAGVATVPAPSLSVGGSATVSAATVPAVAAVPAPAVSTGATATLTTVAGVAAVGVPAVATGARATPGAVQAVASIPAATVTVPSGASVTPATVMALASVPSPTVGTSVVPRPNTGTTAWTATGLIVRPYTGIVTRP